MLLILKNTMMNNYNENVERSEISRVVRFLPEIITRPENSSLIKLFFSFVGMCFYIRKFF